MERRFSLTGEHISAGKRVIVIKFVNIFIYHSVYWNSTKCVCVCVCVCQHLYCGYTTQALAISASSIEGTFYVVGFLHPNTYHTRFYNDRKFREDMWQSDLCSLYGVHLTRNCARVYNDIILDEDESKSHVCVADGENTSRAEY